MMILRVWRDPKKSALKQVRKITNFSVPGTEKNEKFVIFLTCFKALFFGFKTRPPPGIFKKNSIFGSPHGGIQNPKDF